MANKAMISSQDGLTCLPLELLVRILGQFPNLRTILSAILTWRTIYRSFTGYERQILLAVFGRQCNGVKGYWLSQLFWELFFADRHDFVRRDIAEEIVAIGWQVLPEMCRGASNSYWKSYPNFQKWRLIYSRFLQYQLQWNVCFRFQTLPSLIDGIVLKQIR
jgi:hypothetical protein